MWVWGHTQDGEADTGTAYVGVLTPQEAMAAPFRTGKSEFQTPPKSLGSLLYGRVSQHSLGRLGILALPASMSQAVG